MVAVFAMNGSENSDAVVPTVWFFRTECQVDLA
jgi:hypothetical protein